MKCRRRNVEIRMKNTRAMRRILFCVLPSNFCIHDLEKL